MQTLDELIALIPTLVAKKHFTLSYINHLSLPIRDTYLVGYDRYKVNITYQDNIPEPMLFTFDPTIMDWVKTPIFPIG